MVSSGQEVQVLATVLRHQISRQTRVKYLVFFFLLLHLKVPIASIHLLINAISPAHACDAPLHLISNGQRQLTLAADVHQNHASAGFTAILKSSQTNFNRPLKPPEAPVLRNLHHPLQWCAKRPPSLRSWAVPWSCRLGSRSPLPLRFYECHTWNR